MALNRTSAGNLSTQIKLSVSMEVLKTSDEFLTALMEIELQEGRSTDQPVKVNWPSVDRAQNDAQSHAIIANNWSFHLTRHRHLSGSIVV